jgi:diguanylate cyclase (GGDEF)-like protein
MACNLAEGEEFRQNLEILQTFILKMRCSRFYLCLNENWNEIREKRDSGGQKMQLVDTCITEGYTERMLVPLAYVNGEFTSLPAFLTKNMLPECEDEFDEMMMYYMLPLHFRDRCFGYCVICHPNFDMENPLLHTWVMNIANSLESIRKKEYLDRAMHELDQLYVMDPLCKINNRNGFNKFTADIFDECRRLNKSVMMMFIDMDGLKMINDTYSHEEGDNGLKQLARAIKLSCRNGEIYARFGGDEFIIFAPDVTEEGAKALADSIQAQMAEYNATSGKPYPVAASIGWHITQVESDSTLYPLITAADKKMYEDKKKKKVSRYLRH